jgi:hypothetical protein
VKSVFLLLIIHTAVFCSEEGCFGTYYTTYADFNARFVMNEKGVKVLFVNNLKFDENKIIYDYLGTYGNSQILQIAFVDSGGYDNTLKLFMVMNEGDFVMSTGYYLRYKLDKKNKMIIESKRAIELHRVRDSK